MFFRSLIPHLRGMLARPFAPYDRPSRATFTRSPSRDDQRGDPPPSGTGRSTGKLLALTGLALAALLVVAATIAVEAQLADHSQKPNGTATLPVSSGTTASGTPSATGSPSASASATSGSGTTTKLAEWQQAGPTWAQRAAFAETAPSQAYACGYATPNAQTGPISLAVTQDGGATWQTRATPAKGAYCDIHVSTTDPANVALYASALCAQDGCTSQDPSQLYLTTDGGAHWSTAQLPQANGAPAQPTLTLAWAGSTLFVETANSGGHYLAASTGGAAFAWVDQNLSGVVGATPIAEDIHAIGNALYITMTTNTCQADPAGCIIIARTTDGGASWSHVVPTYTGSTYSGVSAIRIVAAAPGAPLIGFGGNCSCTVPPLLRSTDNGATWRGLPAFPSGLGPHEFFTVEAPDGSVYATLSQSDGGSYGIYLLSPGASTWRLIAYPTGDQSWAIETATWDGSGHPTALWGWSWSNSSVEGLWRHTP